MVSSAGERNFDCIVAVRGAQGEGIFPSRGNNCRQMFLMYMPKGTEKSPRRTPPESRSAGVSIFPFGAGRIDREKITMKKVGIIRCQQTEDVCPGTTDFKAAASGSLAFEDLGPAEIIGFVSCGGCSGKRAVHRAKMLADNGAEAILLASCIRKGTPFGMPCPHYENMRDAIQKKIGGIRLIDWTH